MTILPEKSQEKPLRVGRYDPAWEKNPLLMSHPPVGRAKPPSYDIPDQRFGKSVPYEVDNAGTLMKMVSARTGPNPLATKQRQESFSKGTRRSSSSMDMQSSLVQTSTDLQEFRKASYVAQLPSHNDPKYAYGASTRPNESIKDVFSMKYLDDFLRSQQQRDAEQADAERIAAAQRLRSTKAMKDQGVTANEKEQAQQSKSLAGQGQDKKRRGTIIQDAALAEVAAYKARMRQRSLDSGYRQPSSRSTNDYRDDRMRRQPRGGETPQQQDRSRSAQRRPLSAPAAHRTTISRDISVQTGGDVRFEGGGRQSPSPQRQRRDHRQYSGASSPVRQQQQHDHRHSGGRYSPVDARREDHRHSAASPSRQHNQQRQRRPVTSSSVGQSMWGSDFSRTPPPPRSCPHCGTNLPKKPVYQAVAVRPIIAPRVGM